MDIERALSSMKECISTDVFQQKKELFINGYRSEYDLSDEMMTNIPVFKRFANLYTYARILRSVEEKWDNEPQWMTNLRLHLSRLMEEKSLSFGEALA